MIEIAANRTVQLGRKLAEEDLDASTVNVESERVRT